MLNRRARPDRELEQYRDLMTVPSVFGEGFSGSSFVGVLFVALIMVPGALYMELLAGMGVGAAAQWVTVILFIEVAKRANARMSRPQLFVLFYMSGSIVGQAVYGNLLWNQFLVRSDAAVAQGLGGLFPRWFAPLDPAAYDHRTFFQAAWLPALGLFAFRQLFGRIDNAVLGYGLFRLTSDIEKLPFPLAPIGAQGVMALADDLDGKEQTEGAWRWRVFSIGSALGIGFGALYMALPTITGALFPGSAWAIFPIPFVDWTDYTKTYLPAVATGLTFDLGLLILGMVLPYYAMVGSFIGLVATMVMNPLLYKLGVLYSWTPGDLTVDTMFKNYLDLYFSFGIGLSLAVALMGLLSVVRHHRAHPGEQHRVRSPLQRDSRQPRRQVRVRERGIAHRSWRGAGCRWGFPGSPRGRPHFGHLSHSHQRVRPRPPRRRARAAGRELPVRRRRSQRLRPGVCSQR